MLFKSYIKTAYKTVEKRHYINIKLKYSLFLYFSEIFIMVYGYCRVSTKHQRIARQITNIKQVDSNAIIVKEYYTGTTQIRPQWEKLLKQLQSGDTIIFDSVSRMSRNANEGFKDYKLLYEKGVNLFFINEPLIDTNVFNSSKNNLLKITVATGNEAVDDYFKGNITLINNLLMSLAEEQIKTAFLQSEKEVRDLHVRISQGMRESKLNGTKIGLLKGTKLITKKSITCKDIIKKHSKEFGGYLNDLEVIKLCGCSNNTFYKYKKELKSCDA